MKLRKRFYFHFNFRKVFIATYCVMFAIYIAIGLAPAGAAQYETATQITIPSIDLYSDVVSLTLNGDKLDTPDTVVGSYMGAQNKTLLVGHSSTVFNRLKDVKLGDEIIYDGNIYSVTLKRLAEKSVIDMDEILAPAERDTIVVMTCAGRSLGGNDATHRLILQAVRD